MNNTCLKFAAAMIASIGLIASSANASVTTYGCAEIDTCTLQELFDGGYFEVDGLKFSSWSFVSSSYTTPPGEPNPSSINIEIYDSAYLDSWPLQGEGPGCRVIDMTRISGAEHRDFRYKFQVSTLDSNHVINSNLLQIGGWSNGSGALGYLEVNEQVTNSQGMELATKNDFVEVNDTDFISHYDFKEFAPQSMILVETGFLEEGSPSNDASRDMNLTTYWQRFGYTDPTAGCDQSDLSGTWMAYGVTGDTSSKAMPETVRCKIKVNSSGSIVRSASSCKFRSSSGVDKIDYVIGNMEVTSKCVVTGDIRFCGDDVCTSLIMEHGTLSTEKDVLSMQGYLKLDPDFVVTLTGLKR